jgi:hypothetical protein
MHLSNLQSSILIASLGNFAIFKVAMQDTASFLWLHTVFPAVRASFILDFFQLCKPSVF